MLILSASPRSLVVTGTRVPSSPSSSSSSKLFFSISSSLAIRSTVHRCPCAAVFCSSSNSRGMAEMVDDEEAASTSASAAATSSASEKSDLGHSRTFLNVRSEEDILSAIKNESEAGRLPSHVAQGMKELYQNYRNAIFQSGNPKADETVLSNMSVVLDRVFKDVEESFVFLPHHKAMREPFDYYMFGQNYIRPLVDFKSSYAGNISLFHEIEAKLQQGHNVILISNHQTEADPAVIALMLEATNPHVAEKLTYVAGDRVVTDPLCKPFSMGRNLLCVYSKKHMDDDPELAEMKRRANTRSLKEMALLLRGGSQLIWIAPSGGRDRPDPVTGEWCPAPFDASAVDNMRRLTEHAGVPGHIYPLAILCHDIMPPPAQVEKEIGERRVISFHGVGVSVGPAVSSLEIAAASGDPEEVKVAYTQALYDSVKEQYSVLNSAIHGNKGLDASTLTVSLSQPWN